jgi:hypothetical protein
MKVLLLYEGGGKKISRNTALLTLAAGDEIRAG